MAKNQKLRACLKNRNLPANYMSDFTVLGFLVDRLETALGILKEHNFEVHKNRDGIEVHIEAAGRMTEIADVLSRGGIDFALADIADQVYQG
jgi:hypothetical protein